jgi:predicted amidohydrolase YtcJ
VLEFFGRTAGLTPQKLETFMDHVAKAGLGVVDDMLLPDENALHVIRESRWGAQVACWATPQTFSACSPAGQQMVAGLKFFTDGAFGTWTAALRGSYVGGERGLLLYSDDRLLQTLADAHRFRKPVAIHAIGDRAIEQVITTVERLDRDGVRFPGIRLEHAQLIDRAQAERAKDVGIVLSMQPNFNSDSRDYADRLDESRLAANNPFRMLIDEVGFTPGRDLIFGSDGMPHGVEYALQWSLFPAYPGQRLSVDELVAGYGVHPGGGTDTVLDVDEIGQRVTLTVRPIPNP